MIELVSSGPPRASRALLAITLLVATVLACAPPQPTATPTPSPTMAPEATVTDTPQPTEPLTATPSATAVPQPTRTRTATHTATSGPEPTALPTRSPTPSLGVAQVGGQLGEVWNLADVRYALHPDRLRFVLEMAEDRDHVPFYRVVQVDNAEFPFPTGHDPSWGAARIDLVVSDLYGYEPPVLEQLPIVPPTNPRVTRIGQYPTFEDSILGFSIGLNAVATFELRELTDPVRLVIDVLW